MRSSRRRFLAICSGSGVVGTAGCLRLSEPADEGTESSSGSGGSSDAGSSATASPIPERIDPGETRWEFTADAPFQEAGIAVGDTRAVAASDDETVYALNLDSGEIEWTFSEDDWAPHVPFTVADSAVFLVLNSEMVALDADTGEERWRTEAVSSVQRSPPLVVGDGVYVHGGSSVAPGNGVVELDREAGTRRWRVETDATSLAAPALVGETLLLSVNPHGGGRSGRLLGLDAATGEERWRIDRGKPLGGIVFHDGTAYASGENGPLLAIDPQNGDVRWEITDEDAMNNNLSGGNVVTTRAHIFEDRLFFNGQYVLEYDRQTGERIDEVEQVAEPARLFDRNGTLYAISAAPGDGGLYVVRDTGPAELLFAVNTDSSSLGQVKMGTFDADDHTLCIADGSTLRAVWYAE